MIRLEKTYPATAEQVWELWTTPSGIESWWAPDGFRVDVQALDLRPGGEVVYTLTAVAPEQVEFLQSVGLPLVTEARKQLTEVVAAKRLGYRTVVDFVPGHEPYEQLTIVELTPSADGVEVVMSMEPMHDAEWTERLIAGRTNELENLALALAG